MYAVVEIAGQQFKVAKDQRLYVHRLDAKEGDTVDFDNVLLVDNNGKVNVGAPAISGASVTAKVLGHLKGDKVIVFKKKRRKGYQKSNGHRQYLTQIEIQKISEKGGTKAKSAKTEEKKSVEKKAAEPKAEASKATTPKAKAVEKPKAKKEPVKQTKAKDEPKAEKKAPAKKAAPKADAKPKAEKKAKDAGEKKDDK